MSAPYHGVRVVHAANYTLDKDGAAFFSCDLKFHQGLVQNGCHVVPFSTNDRARMLSWTGSKNFGKAAANRALVKTCKNVRPDVLMVGHAQWITRRTLGEIREALPELKIGYWYVDPLWNEPDLVHLHERADLFDAIGCTTGGELLRKFVRPNTPAAFIPNPVEAGVERGRAFAVETPRYDVVFFGREKYASERTRFLQALMAAAPEARFGVFGCLGNPLVFGAEKDAILHHSRMALNLSRRNDVTLYSSDRLAQSTGNGLYTLIQRGAGFEELYAEDEVAFYTDITDLAEQLRAALADPAGVRAAAERGWRRAHAEYSSAAVVKYLLDLTFRRPEWSRSPWGRFAHWPDVNEARMSGRAAA